MNVSADPKVLCKEVARDGVVSLWARCGRRQSLLKQVVCTCSIFGEIDDTTDTERVAGRYCRGV